VAGLSHDLRKVLDKRLTQCKAAEILGLSLRQVERLCRRYRTAGPAALASRRRGRASIAEANAFAPMFMANYNARFAKAPSNAFNAHRPMLPNEKLDDIFTWQETRRVSRSLSFNYQRKHFLLCGNRPIVNRQNGPS